VLSQIWKFEVLVVQPNNKKEESNTQAEHNPKQQPLSAGMLASNKFYKELPAIFTLGSNSETPFGLSIWHLLG